MTFLKVQNQAGINARIRQGLPVPTFVCEDPDCDNVSYLCEGLHIDEQGITVCFECAPKYAKADMNCPICADTVNDYGQCVTCGAKAW